jgi:MFS family permease
MSLRSSVKSVIIADLTNLQNRGLVNGLVTAPFIPNGFIAGYITSGINGFEGSGWRWGYGMFVILTPVYFTTLDPRSLLGSMASKEVGRSGNCGSRLRSTTITGSQQSQKACLCDPLRSVLADRCSWPTATGIWPRLFLSPFLPGGRG